MVAQPTQEQHNQLRDLYRRMKALGVDDDGYPDTRQNGDIFITFRIKQLLPLISLAEAGKLSIDFHQQRADAANA